MKKQSLYWIIAIVALVALWYFMRDTSAAKKELSPVIGKPVSVVGSKKILMAATT